MRATAGSVVRTGATPSSGSCGSSGPTSRRTSPADRSGTGHGDGRPMSRTAVLCGLRRLDRRVILPGRLPAAAGFQHEAGADDRRQEHHDPEGLRLERLHRGPSSSVVVWFPQAVTLGPLGPRLHGPSVPGLAQPSSEVPSRTGAPVPPRIPIASTTTIPTAIRTSPTLKTFASGRAAG